MKYKKLGSSNLEISTIGLGMFATGGEGWKFAWGPQDDGETINAINASLDCGINWVDTAPAYGLGHAETVLGKAIRGKRDKLYVFTKCGRVWDDKGNLSAVLDKESVIKECEDSLRRLDIDCVDLYQIHWPQPDEKIEEAWEAIDRLVKAGKIKYAGVSNFNTAQMKRIMDIAPITSLQPPYSLMRREPASDFKFCEENNIGIIVYSPMAKGLLSGKYNKQNVSAFPETDHRKNDDMFKGDNLEKALRLVELMKPMAVIRGCDVSNIAVTWTLTNSAVTGAICGARSAVQAKTNAVSADIELTAEEISLLNG
ncbi:MAG: aldo/keto reductase [Candidatus Goldbacteria bacterium]|nr:aldo/keto reductase [Candidatus Goldiibacteriota bacterium]